MRKALLIIFLSLLFFNSFPGLVLAQICQGLVPCGLVSGSGMPRCTFCHLFVLFDNIVKCLLLRIVPVLAAAMIAIGGFMYVISQGKPETLSKVKSLFTAVVIGLLIVYGAWALVNLFLITIGAASWQGFGNGWWTIDCQ